MRWMRDKGVRFMPIYGRQAFKVNGKFTFWGGLTVEAVGGGPGLVDSLTESLPATRHRDSIRCAGGGTGFRRQERHRGGGASGRRAARNRTRRRGGARLRGLRGQSGVANALFGPRLGGGQSARHPLQHRGWDQDGSGPGCGGLRQLGPDAMRSAGTETPRSSATLPVGDQFPEALSYPFGIMVNAKRTALRGRGRGLSQLYTYVKYGVEIMRQPGQFVWQIFDAKTVHLLRDEYRIRQVTRVAADSLEELVGRLDDVDGRHLYRGNQSVQLCGSNGHSV